MKCRMSHENESQKPLVKIEPGSVFSFEKTPDQFFFVGMDHKGRTVYSDLSDGFQFSLENLNASIDSLVIERNGEFVYSE